MGGPIAKPERILVQLRFRNESIRSIAGDTAHSPVRQDANKTLAADFTGPFARSRLLGSQLRLMMHQHSGNQVYRHRLQPTLGQWPQAEGDGDALETSRNRVIEN